MLHVVYMQIDSITTSTINKHNDSLCNSILSSYFFFVHLIMYIVEYEDVSIARMNAPLQVVIYVVLRMANTYDMNVGSEDQ